MCYASFSRRHVLMELLVKTLSKVKRYHKIAMNIYATFHRKITLNYSNLHSFNVIRHDGPIHAGR